MAQQSSSIDGQQSIFSNLDEYAEGEDEYNQWKRNVRLWKDNLAEQWAILTDDTMVVAAIGTLSFFVLVAVFAPFLAPFSPTERLYQDGGVLISKWMEPAFLGGPNEYLMGTTAEGYDIFSQLIYGTRPALIVGFIAAILTVGIGTIIGLMAGYFGGYIDDLLMRLVDFVYGMPLLPTVIVLVAILGPSFTNVIFALVLIQWRTSARVIRSQVLSLRERPFVQAAKVSGASDWRIITRHIAPNVLPLSFLYAAFAIAWAILTEAGVSFLGLGDPSQVSWGVMLQNARTYSAVVEGAWWWFVPPGICISLVVISGFLIGRGYEEIVNPELQIE
ncbi:MAG: ABC transporter permease [Halobacteriales archaeon]|nr:ABC transporter permease [Halobacteriales archaeon]